MKKTILLWVLALIIMIGARVYQKMTGPTYPKRTSITLNDKKYDLKLLRSHGGNDDATITLDIDDANVNAYLYFKNYPPKPEEDWTKKTFKHETIDGEKVMTTKLPHQPPAGKLLYNIVIENNGKKQFLYKEEPIVIRFKGGVPNYILLPHIFFMFFAMLLANLTGLFAIFKMPNLKLYTVITLILMTIGGMILGPIVQKFAFLEYWAGVPFGWDLTDNKLLIGFIAWLIAFLMNIKKENRTSVIIAAIVTLIIFSIPHSMFGSELNRETGKVIQGFIQFYF